MDVVVGVLGLMALGWLVLRWRRGAHTQVAEVRPASQPGRAPVESAAASPARPRRDRVTGPVTGIMIGHAVAKGDTGFPGDPLPSGHLGTAANVAFWASMYDEDEDEEL